MIPLTLQQIAEFSGGKLLQGDATAQAGCVTTDSRKIPQGSLFVALVGEHHDGHAYVESAIAQGAVAVITSKPVTVPPNAGVIQVSDTLEGLQRLAHHHRLLWGGRVLGLTGSNGKTSTKDFCHAILSEAFQTTATQGNLNNHIGLPLTCLAANADDVIGVFEMGMNHPGEIAPLAAICAPNAAIITNIGTAHIENMGSREAIALEKGTLAEAVPADGCVILNAEDDYTPNIARRCRASILTAGYAADSSVRILDVQETSHGSRFGLAFPNGETATVELPVAGRHMIANAALAAAAGYYFGLSASQIATGLAQARLNKGRLQIRKVGGYTFIDDSYNANPDSMLAGLATLKAFPCNGRRIAVLGRMAELGIHAKAGHEQVGEAAAASEIVLLCTVGNDDARIIGEAAARAGLQVRSFSSHEDCAAFLADILDPSDVVLVKGSRSAAMEKVIDSLTSLTCSTGSTNS